MKKKGLDGVNTTPMVEGQSVVLRCGDHGPCCPVVTMKNGELVITDDYGGMVRLTFRQAGQLSDLVDRLP